MDGFTTFEFEVNIRTDSIDIIGKEFAEDFAEEMQQDPAVVARTLERALNEAFRKKPPEPLSPLSERGKEVLKHKLSQVVHLLHLSSHELCITSLAEVDRLMNDDKNTINKTKKDIENPFLRTMKKKMPRDGEGADDDNDLKEDDTKKKKQKVLLGDNKTATTPRSGKQGGNDERLKLPPLSREEAYRFGEIEPSVGYIAEARQNEWEELQRKWWTNNKKCCPHILLVVGARGVGKSEYASFVAGTLTHLIPRFEPEFQVRFKYSSALGSMSKYTEALLGSGSRNAADWRKDVKRKLKEDPASIIKTLLLPTPTANVPISLETERYQALSFKRKFLRRAGVIVLDDVPSSRSATTTSSSNSSSSSSTGGVSALEEIMASPLWPRESSSFSSQHYVLIITTRSLPFPTERLPTNVVVQKLGSFDPITTCRYIHTQCDDVLHGG